MSRLSLLDSNFLMTENRDTPMHVGGLFLYRYPDGVDKRRYLQGLREILLAGTDLRPHFGERLSKSLLSRLNLSYSWEFDDDIDMEYHVRHSALPAPGRYRELFTLVSRLHSTLLDRSRPLWEIHLIEGLAENQFATYFKIHHSMMDGMAGMHMVQSMMSDTPEGRTEYSPLSRVAWEKYKRNVAKPETASISTGDIRSLAGRIGEQIGSTKNLTGALMKYANVWLGGGRPLSVPWHTVPRGSTTSAVSGSRRFVAQSWPAERIRRLSKALGGTLNDAVLAVCSGALRNYLLQYDDLPDKPLKAMIPISLRVEGDLESSNAVGFIVSSMATNLADAGDRYRAIQESMRAGKSVFTGLSPGEASLFTQITNAPLLVLNLLGVGNFVPPYNLVISNVPGPRQRKYWNGSPLEGMYPASIVFHGMALNITLMSYAGNIDFGIIACRRSMPSVQRLIDLIEDSLGELEQLAGIAD